MPDGERAHPDAHGLQPPPYALEPLPDLPEGVAGARLIGEWDIASVPELAALTAGAIASGARALVLDLAELRFLDSSILRELLTARSGLNAPVVLVSAQEPARRLFTVTGTDALFTFADDIAAARAAIA